MTLGRAPTGVFEPSEQLDVRGIRIGSAWKPLPFAARPRQLVDQRLAAQCVHALAQRQLRGAHPRELLGERELSRTLFGRARYCCLHGCRRRRESRALVRRGLCRRFVE